MFKSQNVAVTFRQESVYPQKYGSFSYWVDDKDDYGFGAKTNYIMEVSSVEFLASIKICVANQFLSMTDSIASCLVAAMKLIDGYEMVYEEVISQFRNNLGIQINRDVSHKIAKITSEKSQYNMRPIYEIDIPLGFGFYSPSHNDLVANLINEIDKIKFVLKVHSRGKTFLLEECVDGEVWHLYGHECMKTVQAKMIQELHEKIPEWGMDWEILRTQWFGNSPTMKKKGIDSYYSGYKPHAKILDEAVMSDPPTSIKNLPGVNEVVKHPVDGRPNALWNVIVDLNDRHGWSREQVADWLETLDIDISFRSNNEQD